MLAAGSHKCSDHRPEPSFGASHFLSVLQPQAQGNREKSHQLEQVEECDRHHELEGNRVRFLILLSFSSVGIATTEKTVKPYI